MWYLKTKKINSKIQRKIVDHLNSTGNQSLGCISCKILNFWGDFYVISTKSYLIIHTILVYSY